MFDALLEVDLLRLRTREGGLAVRVPEQTGDSFNVALWETYGFQDSQESTVAAAVERFSEIEEDDPISKAL